MNDLKPSPEAEAFARIAADSVRVMGAAMAKVARRMYWTTAILFADSEKESRRLVRNMAREYRRPALIHKGGKP